MMRIPPSLSPDGHAFSIMRRIVDGTLKVDSVDEFEDIMAFYPDDPFLLRKYSDLLLKKKDEIRAHQGYGKAADHFIAQGMNLQAIVAKILQWSIRKPSHEHGRAFHALLLEKGSHHTPLQRFWARMRYREFIAVVLRLVRVQFKAGYKIVAHGDRADQVCFVVSGALSETPSQDCETQAAAEGFETEPALLGTNDIYGDIFPLDKPTIATTEIRTLTDVEVVKIEKTILHQISEKHPNIKTLLEDLYRKDTRRNCDRTWQTVRRSLRFDLPIKAELSCYRPGSSYYLWRHNGTAVDISLGGMCVDMGPSFPPFDINKIKGQPVNLLLSPPPHKTDILITGKIVWYRQQRDRKNGISLIGIRFDTLSKQDRDLLFRNCKESS